MQRKAFRKAMVRAKMVLLHGMAWQEEEFSPLEAQAAKLLMANSQHYDSLAARQSGFTEGARSRIVLYPLAKRAAA